MLVLPACLLYTDNTADWGDDWAAYYAEAHNISDGQPVAQTHYRHYDYNDHYAPPSYPAGYPLVLAPVVAKAGMDMRQLGWYMSLWTAAWIALAGLFMRRRCGLIAAICGVFTFLLSPYVLETKGRVWSDIPFSFFLLAALWLYAHRARPRYAIAAGLCLGIAISMRSVGAVVVAAMCVDALLAYAAAQDRRTLVAMVMLLSAAAMPVAVVRLLYPVPAEGYYMQQLGAATADHTVSNILTYLLSLDHFLTGRTGWQVADVHLLTWLVVTSIAACMMTRRQERVLLLTTILMLMVIVIFPDTQDMRYMLPLLPLLAYYLLAPVALLYDRVGRMAYLIPIVLLLWTGILHRDQYTSLWQTRYRMHTYGPFTAKAQKGLAEIKNVVPAHNLILCRWPRVTGLLTDRDCCVIPEGDIALQLKSAGTAAPDYILSIEERDAEMTDQLAMAHGDSIVYQSSGFTLYQCRPWR